MNKRTSRLPDGMHGATVFSWELPVGTLELSIAANDLSRCTPKRNLQQLEDFTHVEAILSLNGFTNRVLPSLILGGDERFDDARVHRKARRSRSSSSEDSSLHVSP